MMHAAHGTLKVAHQSGSRRHRRTPNCPFTIVLGLSLLVMADILVVPDIGAADQPQVDQPQADLGTHRTPADTSVHRSPRSVAISPDRQWIAVANATGGSISLIEASRREVRDELIVGRGVQEICWLDNGRLVASVSELDQIVLMTQAAGQLDLVDRFVVGDEPGGICRLSDHEVAVALRGDDELAIVDMGSRQVAQRLPVAGYPEHVTVSPDGRWLVSVCSLPGAVFVHAIPGYELVSRRVLMEDGFRPGNPLIGPDSQSVEFACLINRHLPVDPQNIERGWMLDNRLASFVLPDAPFWRQRQIGLDIRGDAIGDPHWGALSPDGRRMVVSCGGSHELVLLNTEKINWPPSNTEDFLPTMMQDDSEAYTRVPVGGRPLGLAFVDERTVVVANYFRDSLQWVDLDARTVIGETPLGAPPKISLVREGESIFYDADRSLHSWFSCHTCHTDGHTAGQVWDTVNDDSYGTFKLTPTLRGVVRTAPWTWHGWQDSLDAAMRKSLKDTLNTTVPISDRDVQSLLAFLKTLEHPSNPNLLPMGQLTADQQAGRRLFAGKANCSQCHQGPELTSPETFDVGLGRFDEFYQGFNPPSLRSLHSRRRFLHDGRGDTLEEVLTQFHSPQRVGGEKLSNDELAQLLQYLNSL